jgi:hypothetical protein
VGEARAALLYAPHGARIVSVSPTVLGKLIDHFELEAMLTPALACAYGEALAEIKELRAQLREANKRLGLAQVRDRQLTARALRLQRRNTQLERVTETAAELRRLLGGFGRSVCATADSSQEQDGTPALRRVRA